MLSFLLVRLYTGILPTAEYGEVSIVLSWMVFFNVVLSYGMETAFFRFYSAEEDKKNVLQTVENSAKGENVMQIVTSPEKKYNEELSKLNNDDWQSYVKSEIEELTRTNKFFKTTNCVIKCFTK